jgi:hypothetical protein
MNPECIRNITKGCNGFKYTKILSREWWVRYLETNTHNQLTSKEKHDKLFSWVANTRITTEELGTIITSMTSQNRLS